MLWAKDVMRSLDEEDARFDREEGAMIAEDNAACKQRLTERESKRRQVDQVIAAMKKHDMDWEITRMIQNDMDSGLQRRWEKAEAERQVVKW